MKRIPVLVADNSALMRRKIQTLIADLALKDEGVRSEAAEDLGYSDSLEAITPLVERLAIEPSRKVRETIFLALERMDRHEVCRHLGLLLDSHDAFVRNQAVGLLQRSGAAAVPVLLARMNDADPDVRKLVLDAAGGIPSLEIELIYEAAIRDPDTNVVIAALEHLGGHRLIRFRPAVEEIFIKATQPMLVCAAFDALLQIGDGGSWQCIRRRYPTAASVPKWELGWWIRALGDFGGPGEIEIEIFHEFIQRHPNKFIPDTIDALERFQSRHGRMAITGELWMVLRERLEPGMAAEDKLQLLRVFGGFSAPPAIGQYLVELLGQDDQVTKLGAIEGIQRLGRPDLMEVLRHRCGLEADPEVAEALRDA